MANEKSILGDDFLPDYMPSSDEKIIAVMAHILSFIAPILAPLVIYVLKKNESSFIAYHAKESLNFHLTLVLLFFLSWILILVLIGFILLWGISVFSFMLILIAAIRAFEGRLYRYPFNIRFIK